MVESLGVTQCYKPQCGPDWVNNNSISSSHVHSHLPYPTYHIVKHPKAYFVTRFNITQFFNNFYNELNYKYGFSLNKG